MFCPWKQQWTGHFWESHVQHQHKSCWGESCPLWPQSQHHLHHGLMSIEYERKTGETKRHIQLFLVGLTWIYIDISIFPVSNDIQQRHRIAQKHKAHFQQHLTAVAIDHIENLKDYWEKKRRSHTFPGLPVARWRKVFFTLCECWLYEYNSLWHIDKIEYFMLCSINIEGLLHNAK